jgi:hypothetical protein
MKLTSQRKFESRLEKAFCYCSDAPDYGPMAQASKESAEIMAALGKEQLDFTKAQYAENAPILQDIAKKQIEVQDQTLAQGKDYYDYMVSQQRPVEEALNKDAMAAGSEEAQEIAAGKAAADARQGTTSMQNQIIRQGLRYGYSPAKLASMAGDTAAAQGLSVASAMNQAREKEKTLGYAKKMDVAGLYRGLAGASQGAYGVALNAGNSAGQNQMQPGQVAMQGMAQGTNTIGAGRSMYQSGLSNVLNAQVQSAGQGMDVGGLMSGAASLFALSDRNAKEGIELVGVDAATGLNLYEFNYTGEVERYIGVMADEVEKVRPDAVIEGADGYKRVNYAELGIEMKEARHAA